MGFLMPPHPLTNFEIQKYYQNEPRFNGVYLRDNLPKKIKDGDYVETLMNMRILEHTGLLHFVEKLKLSILIVLVLRMFQKNLKNIKANIFRVQVSNSIMCRYFCIAFICR